MTNSNLHPEYKWTVRIVSDILHSVDWYGEEVILNLSEIVRFYVRTTNQGPFLPDVWYGIVCKNGKIEIPQGATGENLIHDFAEKLDGYRLDGMSSVENRVFDLDYSV
jgi:hypothetical protein